MISREELRELLSYNPDTGVFTWIKSINPRAPIGWVPHSVAGNGYYVVNIRKRTYYQHRLAIFYMTGEWPPHDVDHINGDIKDNRICNLRVATRSQNLKNISAHKDSATGFKGVSYDARRSQYMARIYLDGRAKNLGRFRTAEEAAAAYQEAARKHHGEFYRAA